VEHNDILLSITQLQHYEGYRNIHKLGHTPNFFWSQKSQKIQAGNSLHLLVANLEGKNARIFQGEEHSVSRVASLIQDQIQALAVSRGESSNAGLG
jgi:hypothetical protein